MPLQIRRGTDIERLTITPAAGELIFASNTGRLYVGNGVTVGGVLATGYNAENAQDDVAPMFVSGTHTGISFVYDDAAIPSTINATVDLSNYQGVIRADAFKGSVFADDSTMMIDGLTAKFNLDGTVSTNIVPDVDVAYDLGSATFRFRDLYLSGSSIKLGAATITATGTAVNLPAGSTIGGSAIGIPGGDLNVNIVADDSTVIVNTVTEVVTAQGGFVGNVTGNVTGVVTGTAGSSLVGNVTGVVTGTAGSSLVGNVTGNISSSGASSFASVDINSGTIDNTSIGVTTPTTVRGTVITATIGFNGNIQGNVFGDVKGSVFADDSTLLVDGVSNILSNGVTTISADSITSLTDELIIGNPTALTGTTLTFNQPDANSSLDIKNVAAAVVGSVSKLSFTGYKTSLITPGNPTAGDFVGVLAFSAYSPAISNKLPVGIISAGIDPLGSYNTSVADGKLEFITASIAGGTTLRYFTFDRLGQLAVNQQTALATLDVAGTIRTSGYTVATLPTGVIGMLAYVTDALGPTYLGTLTGGGAVKVPVFHNGTAWVSH